LNKPKDIKINIREMTLNDINVIKKIEYETYKKKDEPIDFYNEIKNHFSQYVIAEIIDIKNEITNIIGFAGIWIFQGETHIAQIAVAKKWQRKNIGNQLLKHCTALAKEYGAQHIVLEVHEKNITSNKFFSANNFIEIKKKKNYYKNKDGTYSDAIIMKKILFKR
jgi:ribosomal-protein-alanine N-acetyltransferase